MLQLDLTARVRQTFGKGAARVLRRAGQTPAVLYGPKVDSLALELDTKSFTKALLSVHRQNVVINLDIDDGKKTSKRHVMTKELQTDPVQDTLVHADFYEISLDEPMTLDVPLKFTGKAKGVDMGGELQIAMTKVALKGNVLDLPDVIEIDVTPLMAGQSFCCKDIQIPENVKLQKDAEKVCVSVISAEMAAAAHAAADAAAEAAEVAQAEEAAAPAAEAEPEGSAE